MRASPDFKFWTPEEAMQFIPHGIAFAGGGYKSRMAKAGRLRLANKRAASAHPWHNLLLVHSCCSVPTAKTWR